MIVWILIVTLYDHGAVHPVVVQDVPSEKECRALGELIKSDWHDELKLRNPKITIRCAGLRRPH